MTELKSSAYFKTSKGALRHIPMNDTNADTDFEDTTIMVEQHLDNTLGEGTWKKPILFSIEGGKA